jgi:hypothetical protein
MKGFGTDEAMLCRALVGNGRAMALETTARYAELYEKETLAAALKKEISGNFLKACEKWVGPLAPECLEQADMLVAPLEAEAAAKEEEERQAAGVGGAMLDEEAAAAAAAVTGGAEAAAAAFEEIDAGDELGFAKMLRAQLLEYVALRDARSIRKACKGFGTDEASLIKILCCRTQQQIARINRKFEIEFENMTLRQQIKSECSGDFGRMLKSTLEDGDTLDAELLYKAMKGWGTTESVLTEIICTSDNGALMRIQEAFKEEYDSELEGWIKKEATGRYQKLLLAKLECKGGPIASEAEADDIAAQAEVSALYDASMARMWGSDPQVNNCTW